MSAQAAQLREDRAQYQEQLDLVLASLRDDPGNEELRALKEELQSALAIIDDSLAELKPKSSSSSSAAGKRGTAAAPEAAQSADGGGSSSAAPPPSHVYKVNESVLARWVSGDKAFYPARIMSVTGSATAPLYTVKFKSYDTIETLRARDVRPLANSSAAAASGSSSSSGSSSAHKRKAESGGHPELATAPASAQAVALPSQQPTPPPPPPPTSSEPALVSHAQGHQPPPPPPPPASAPAPPPPAATAAVAALAVPRPSDRFHNGVVSSAAAQLYPQAAAQLQEQRTGGSGSGFGSFGHGSGGGGSSAAAGASAAGADDQPPVKKFKKIKATKQLEAGKSKWQEFSSKAKTAKAGAKKDSMFRTPEGIHGRVGFVGSGQAMRKDPTRSRHIYQANEDLD